MTDPVKTACFCPNTPHEFDEFYLTDELPIEAGLSAAVAQQTSDASNAVPQVIAAVLRNGAIVRWNLVDKEGDLLPVTPANVAKRVTWLKGGVELSSAALARYVNADDSGPFDSTSSPKKSARSSRGGRTARSTSAKSPSSPAPPAPSE